MLCLAKHIVTIPPFDPEQYSALLQVFPETFPVLRILWKILRRLFETFS